MINEAQKWPDDKERYDRNFDRIFGSKCGVCKGEGYLEDKDNKGKVIRTTCLICGGKGELYPKEE